MSIETLSIDDFAEIRGLSQEYALGITSERELQSVLTNKNYYNRTIFYNGEFAGFVIARLIISNLIPKIRPAEAEIHHIAVKREFQNKRIGRILLSNLINECFRSDIGEIWLEVRKSNVKALAFYKKNGFEILYTRKNYYSEPVEDASVMRRRL